MKTLNRIFPDIKVEAYYDEMHQMINISKYDKAEFGSFNFDNPTAADIDKVSLFEHEFIHWLDHISTLWGQENLVLLYNALNARAIGNPEEFYRIKLLYSKFKSDRYHDYFTEKYTKKLETIKTPWRSQISSGIRFSESGHLDHNKPILFVRFSSFDGIPVIRVPLSISSILESNAVNSEFNVKLAAATQIEDLIERKIQISRINKEWIKLLYNKDLALYSAIAHVTANINGFTDPIQTYNLSSTIGTLVLNLPSSLYSTMTIISEENQEFNRRYIEFIKNLDKGFAFYNLLKNLKKVESEYSLNLILKSSNLPNELEIQELVINEMEENISRLIDGPFKKLATSTIKKGIEILKIRGIDGKRPHSREKILQLQYSPTIIFGDTIFDDQNFEIDRVMQDLNNSIDVLPESLYHTVEYFDSKFKEFLNACGT